MSISDCQQDYTYENFDSSYSIRPCKVYYPQTITEISQIIKNNQNSKIRASGGYHVFNDLSGSDEIMVRFDRLNKILIIDSINRLVKVESGAIIYDLAIQLANYGLAFHVLPAIAGQSLVGALSTATHGSRADRGTMVSAIRALEVVLADGSIHQINSENPLFAAMTVSLGTLGLIYSVTLQCEDLYDIEEEIVSLQWSQLIPILDLILIDNTMTQIELNHQSNDCQIIIRRKISMSQVNSDQKSRYGQQNIQRGIYYQMIASKNSRPYTEMEIAISYKYLIRAIGDILNLLKTHNNSKFISPTILIRFSGTDKNSYISMASNFSLIAYISLFSESKNATKEELLDILRFYEDLMIRKYKGRPHYGKKHFLSKKKMFMIYPEFSKFLEIKQLLDPLPNDLFSNNHLKRLTS